MKGFNKRSMLLGLCLAFVFFSPVFALTADHTVRAPGLQAATQSSGKATAPKSSATPASLPTAVAPSTPAPNVLPTATENSTFNNQVWNFKNMDLVSLIKQVGKTHHKNFVFDSRVKGKVTFLSNQALSANEQYHAFLTLLHVQGYAAVPKGAVIEIVPENEVKGLDVPIYNRANVATIDDRVMAILHVQNVAADQMVQLLDPMATKTSYIAAYQPTNDLIVSDRKSNVETIANLVRKLDQDANLKFYIIRLKYVAAESIAKVLNTLFGGTQASYGGAGGNTFHKQINFATDPRTHSLVVRGGSIEQINRVRDLVRSLDIRDNASDNVTEVINLKQLRAQNLAPILNKLIENYLGVKSEGIADESASAQPPVPTTNLLNPMAAYNAANPQTGNTLASTMTSPQLPDNDFFKSDGGKKASGSAYIQWEDSTNAIIITAPPKLMSVLKKVITKLDVRRPQILIEAVIAELTTDRARELGVEMSVGGALKFNSRFLPTLPTSVISNTGLINTASTGTGVALGQGLTASYSQGDQLRFLLRALEIDNRSNVVATPNLVTLDNEPAQIKVGQKVSFAIGQIQNNPTGGNPFTSFELEDVGLTLTIRPQITTNGGIKLVLEQELSNVIPGTANPNTGNNPTLSQRMIRTTVIVKNGEVLVLGGLLQNQTQDTVSKVPILGDFPLVGGLFRNKFRDVMKTNLVVFLRPVILDDAGVNILPQNLVPIESYVIEKHGK